MSVQKVRVFTAHLSDMQKYHRQIGDVVKITTPVWISPQDSTSADIVVRMSDGRMLTLPEGCIYELIGGNDE
jgi:hypothetical protein